MQTVRNRKRESVTVAPCPICGGEHDFDLQATIDEVIGIMHMYTTRTEMTSCSLSCPEKGSYFVVDVPVVLSSGQSLVSIK